MKLFGGSFLALLAALLVIGFTGGVSAEPAAEGLNLEFLTQDGEAENAFDPEVPDELHGEPHLEHGKSEEAQEKAGLPQLDPAWFPSQIFWLFVTFGVMYIGFSKKILPGISGTIENRREHIQNDLDTAHELKDQAEKAQKRYEELLAGAFQQTTDLMQKNDDDIKAKYDEFMNNFRLDANKQMSALEKEIASEKKKALEDMHNIAAEIASIAAKKIVGVDTDIKQVRDVVKNIDKKAA